MSAASCALLELSTATDSNSKRVGVVHTAAAAQCSAPLYAVRQGVSRVLVCCAERLPPPEDAPAWARGLIGELKPRRLLLLGTMPADQYRGGGVRAGEDDSVAAAGAAGAGAGAAAADPSQQLLAFLLRSGPVSRGAQQDSASSSAPLAAQYLPSGSVVGGAPAALLAAAEMRALPAELLVVVDAVPALIPCTLAELSALIVRGLRGALPQGVIDKPDAWLGGLCRTDVLDAARVHLQRGACRPNSVYI